MPQPALLLGAILDEIQSIKDEATNEEGFHFELVNQIRVQHVIRDLKKERDRKRSGEVLDLLGRAYCLRKDEQKSRAYHLKSIELESSVSTRWFDFAVTLGTFNHHDESAEYYRKTLELDSSDLDAWNYLLKRYMLTAKYREALEVVDEVIKRKNTKENRQMKEYILELYYPPEEEISDELVKAVRESEEDIKAGRFTRCNTKEESKAFLDSLMSE